MIARLGALLRPLALAWLASLCGGCAALWSGQPRETISAGAGQEREQRAPLQQEPLREIQVTQVGLRAEVALSAVERCAVQRVRVVPRTQTRWTSYPRWVWGLAGAEVALAAASWQLAEAEALGRPASPLLWSAAAAALIAAGVDTLAASGALARPQRLELPPAEDPEPWRVIECGRSPLAAASVLVHGARADAAVPVDLSGRATLDLATLPAPGFPYQTPFVELSCDGCRRVAVPLDPAAAAQLVLGRGDPDDLDTWLALHPASDRRPQVDAALRILQESQSRARQQALRAAQAAFDQGDLSAAAHAVRRCQAIARTPAAACDALGHLIEDRFVQQQFSLGREALARGDLGQAEAAHYRCTLVDAARPACAELQRLIAAEREAQAMRAEALALARQKARDTGLSLALRKPCRKPKSRACQHALDRCLALSPQHPDCQRLTRRTRQIEVR